MPEKESNIVNNASMVISIAVIATGVLFKEEFLFYMNKLFTFLSGEFNWVYLVVVASYVFFLLYLALSKYGSIKLGPDDSVPDFSMYSWIAMLFSISLGVGIVFFGVYEPVYHFYNPPMMEPATPQAAAWSMQVMFLHWGFHPWAVYAFTGLGMGYFTMRRGKPLLVSSTLESLIDGKKYQTVVANGVDTWVVFLTIIGLASAFGMACSQITAGLSNVFGTPNNFTMYMVINALMTVVYIYTCMSGVEKGIKIVSDVNLGLAIFLLISIFVMGPSMKIIQILVSSFGNYMQDFIKSSFYMDPFDKKFGDWHQWWTIFYWAWWCSWGAFCGSFIARISRGRTIRQFVFGAIGIPPLVLFIWFSVFGGTGITFLLENPDHPLRQIVQGDSSMAHFEFLKFMPLTKFYSILSIVLLFTFMITSANSGTYVLGTLSSNGKLNPTKKRLLVWGVLMAMTAAIIYRSGGIKGLQMAALCVTFPYQFLTIGMMISIMIALRKYELPKLQSAKKQQ
ncbi:glycine/betaine ABC transporter permease [Synergistales bacterium]|nr:glycine/betaine ABC transporter permease [Synergistales bacterium]